LNFKKRLRHGFFCIIKHSLNPLTLRMARSSCGPFSIIRHVGRHSGKLYETPIVAIPVEDGFVIELTYGYDVDWHKNVLAAGGCTVIWRGKQYPIDGIEPLDTETGMAAFPWLARVLLRLLRRKHFEKLKSRVS
jgi:deazaflavin-dependent oxidoreductase (nitroreductase family)